MQIEFPPELIQRVKKRAARSSGATEVDVIRAGLEALDDRDAERQAIQVGIDAMHQERVQDFHEFDREFCQENGVASLRAKEMQS